jgi:hypothetical protein
MSLVNAGYMATATARQPAPSCATAFLVSGPTLLTLFR